MHDERPKTGDPAVGSTRLVQRVFHSAIIGKANDLPTGELKHGNPAQIKPLSRERIRQMAPTC
jgi:hypothetical protein